MTRARELIKKLLRLSKSTSNKVEAATFRARAHELMEKHRIHVALDEKDEIRRAVKGVAGAFWREQLLVSVARVYSCRVLRPQDRKVAVLAGHRDDVEAAVTMYEHVQMKLVIRCYRDWRELAQGLEPATSIDGEADLLGDFDEEIMGLVGNSSMFRLISERARERVSRDPAEEPRSKQLTKQELRECSAAYFRVYLDLAAGEITKRFANLKPRKKPAPQYEAPPISVPRPPASNISKEQEKEVLTGDRKRLAELIGEASMRQLMQSASVMSVQAVNSIDWAWRSSKRLLCAASQAFPPPPPPPRPPDPSRFNQLELD